MKVVRKSLLCSLTALMVFQGDAQITPHASPIHQVNPKYPEHARKKDAQGRILLQATIATDGSVEDVTVENGDPQLTPAAVDAVRQWRYVPEMRNGEAVESHTRIILEYDLSKGASRPGDPSPGVPTAPTEDLLTEIASGQVCQVGSGVTAPKVVYAPNPEYSEAARLAKFQGTGVVGLVLGPDGFPRDVWIIRGLGMGLDERSIESVKQWKFRPAEKDGNPVAVLLSVETSFRIH